MRHLVKAIALGSALALASCSGAPLDRYERLLTPAANPGQVVATELAFARMGRDEGTWTAFREYSTGDAVWPAPGFVNVRQSLEGQADPAEAVVWEPDQVWSSCDGSFAVTTGPARWPDGRTSRFMTVWQRQGNGEYRWVLDQGFDLDAPYADPELVATRTAECPPREDRAQRLDVRRGEAWASGASNDRTLTWSSTLRPDCSRLVSVSIAADGAMEEVFRREAPAPAPAAGEPAPRCPA